MVVSKPWLLRCDDHTSSHRSQEAAEAQKKRVEEFGKCLLPHEVVLEEKE